MKKLLQICLIVVLVFILFQASAGGVGMGSATTDLAASHTSSMTNASAEVASEPSCWKSIRGCVMPNVGWNS